VTRVGKQKLQDIIATLFFAFSFFSFGEAVFEGHVNYPAWLVISDQSFQAYHQALSSRIAFLIVPLALTTVLNVLLIWWRPPCIPGWAVWTTLGLSVSGWISTLSLQIPIQMQLYAHGYSAELLQRLIWTDLLYRKIPGYIRLVIVGWMLYVCIKTSRGQDPTRIHI